MDPPSPIWPASGAACCSEAPGLTPSRPNENARYPAVVAARTWQLSVFMVAI